MYCENCGKHIDDNSKFCRYCGTKMEGEITTYQAADAAKNTVAGTATAKKERKKLKMGIIVVASITVVVAVALFVGISVYNSPEKRLTRALSLDQKYLHEMDYEQAVVEFKKAIEIDPKCVEAYLGLADAYATMEDYDTALELLQEGYDLTESESIYIRMEALEALLAKHNEPSDDQDNTVEPAQTVTFLAWADAGLEDHVMEWGDEGLEQGMREMTGIKNGDIMLSDVWEMTELDLSGKNIGNITALGELTNLTNLILYGNQISDISPLSSLTSLTELVLSVNQISDISPLTSLTSLTELGLHFNQISDISPLSSLTNLTDLSLKDNQISDISPLTSLTNLMYLYLGGNNITDYSSLDHFPDGVVDKEYEQPAEYVPPAEETPY